MALKTLYPERCVGILTFFLITVLNSTDECSILYKLPLNVNMHIDLMMRDSYKKSNNERSTRMGCLVSAPICKKLLQLPNSIIDLFVSDYNSNSVL